MRLTSCGLAAAYLFTALTLSATHIHADESAPPALAARGVIYADRPGATIDPHIYGQFAEHLGRGIYEGVWVGEHSPIPNVRGLRTDVVTALRELHVPVVRWPGGCFADEYHWRDGIGPRAKRPVTLNTNWGGVPDNNEFGTHEFLDFAEMIGADAYINGNLGTGSAREMAEWLQYMTSDKPTSLTAEGARNGRAKPWKTAYFAVGNEAWGCGGHDNDTSWTEALIAKVHQDMGAISFHYYTFPGDTWKSKGPTIGFGEGQWISTLAHTLRMEDFIAKNVAVLDKYDPQKKVSFAVDEWGTWYDPEPGREEQFLYQQNTLRDALVAAINLNIFQHHADRVHLTDIAQMVNVLQAMILTKGPQMVLTPTYHVFHMYIPFQRATSLDTELSAPRYTVDGVSVPPVSMSAARTAAGAIVMSLVNLNPNISVSVSVRIDGADFQHVTGELLSAAAMDARNTFDAPNAVLPVPLAATLDRGDLSLTLSAKSIAVLNLQ
ncbi:MAG: alpha-L-arabinofuranosidase C-terminal domain-containing protein [Gammaproteobacteria bacterium]